MMKVGLFNDELWRRSMAGGWVSCFLTSRKYPFGFWGLNFPESKTRWQGLMTPILG
jgi:hypothetical protein